MLRALSNPRVKVTTKGAKLPESMFTDADVDRSVDAMIRIARTGPKDNAPG